MQSKLSAKKLELIQYFLTLAGIAISLYLTYAKLTSQGVICGFGGCQVVQQSQYSEIFGIPVAAFGVGFYFVLLALFYYKKFNIVNNMLGFGLLFYTYLTYLEFFVIKAFCEWCVASFVALILISALQLVKPVDENFQEKHAPKQE